MKSVLFTSLVLALVSAKAFAADSCVSNPDQTFAQIISEQHVDIGDIKEIESDMKEIGAAADSELSDTARAELDKIIRRDRLAIKIHVQSTLTALNSIKGMKGETAYGNYVKLTTTAVSYYDEVLKVAQKYVGGSASASDVSAVTEKLKSSAQQLAVQGQSVVVGLKSLPPGTLGQLASIHAKASQVERCKLARKMFQTLSHIENSK